MKALSACTGDSHVDVSQGCFEASTRSAKRYTHTDILGCQERIAQLEIKGINCNLCPLIADCKEWILICQEQIVMLEMEGINCNLCPKIADCQEWMLRCQERIAGPDMKCINCNLCPSS